MATKTQIPTILEINSETGEENLRPLTDEELQQREIDNLNAFNFLKEMQTKISARQSALAKLAELGLTEEEIQAL